MKSMEATMKKFILFLTILMQLSAHAMGIFNPYEYSPENLLLVLPSLRDKISLPQLPLEMSQEIMDWGYAQLAQEAGDLQKLENIMRDAYKLEKSLSQAAGKKLPFKHLKALSSHIITREKDQLLAWANKMLGDYEEFQSLEDTVSRRTPLLMAISREYSFLAQALIHFGANVNAQGVKGTALHEAIYSQCDDKKELIELLIDKGADVNIKNKSEHTPLHVAIRENMPGIVKDLVKKGADINAQTSKGCTPLHDAIFCRNKEIVKYLVATGADKTIIYSNDGVQGNALQIACETGNEIIIDLLQTDPESLARKRRLPPFYFLHLTRSIRSDEKVGDIPWLPNKVKKEIVDHIYTLQAQEAVNLKQLETLKQKSKVLEAQYQEISGNKSGFEHLEKVYQEKKIVFLEIINKELAKKGLTNFKVVRDGLTYNWQYTTPLFCAVKNEDLELVKLLLEHGADVNCGDRAQKPLHAAAELGNEEIVKVLLSNGANASLLDSCNNIALEVAVSKGKTRVVEIIENHIKNLAHNNESN